MSSQEESAAISCRQEAEEHYLAGRYDDAEACYRRALPVDYLSYYRLVHCRRITEADQPLIAEMQRRSVGTEPERAVHLHYALGKCFDDIGAYELARQHFEAANAIRRQDVPWNRESFDRLVAACLQVVRPLPPPAPLTDIFVIGLPRSGTTLLDRMLSAHPRAVSVGENMFFEELAFRVPRYPFCDALYEEGAAYHEAEDDAVLVNKFPDNAWHASFIARTLPGARFVWLVRHRWDTAVSIFQRDLAATSRLHWTADLADIDYYRERFDRHLMAFASLNPERVIVVSYEQLVREPRAELRRILDFLGLPWSERCLVPHENRGRTNLASGRAVSEPLSSRSIGRWRNYATWFLG